MPRARVIVAEEVRQLADEREGDGHDGDDRAPATLVPGRLTILRAGGGALAKITFQGQPGRDHQLERSATLGQWTTVLTTNTLEGAFSYSESATNAASHFRVLTR